jgi:hypothetical protein
MSSVHKHRSHHLSGRGADDNGWVESITRLTDASPATALLSGACPAANAQVPTQPTTAPVDRRSPKASVKQVEGSTEELARPALPQDGAPPAPAQP